MLSISQSSGSVARENRVLFFLFLSFKKIINREEKKPWRRQKDTTPITHHMIVIVCRCSSLFSRYDEIRLFEKDNFSNDESKKKFTIFILYFDRDVTFLDLFFFFSFHLVTHLKFRWEKSHALKY